MIQARYGWTDDVVFNLPYSRFSQLSTFLLEKLEEETREKYILQAFGAWLNGAGQKKTFKQFLKHLRLEKPKSPNEQKVSREETKLIAKRNIENAQKILLLDRQSRNPKKG